VVEHAQDEATSTRLRRNLDPTAVRRIILEQSRRANVGHIGSSLSVVEILCAIYNSLRLKGHGDPDRDRFVLSKGHAALGLYATLSVAGFLSQADLDTFCGDDSLVGVHPEAGLPGVDFSTGSLGQGLSLACGAALASRIQHSERRVFCLLSDAECNEGSVWEAAMFAAHNRLGHLMAFVDVNGQQALGLTRDILNQSNLGERWRAFGWRVAQVDGHSMKELSAAIEDTEDQFGKPTVVLARTVIGKGVPFMEQGRSITQTHVPDNPVNWHYLPMSDHEFELAMRALQEVSIA
jgi:transketolase